MADLQFQSRDEAKRKRELEEARKAGTAPAEKDEEGRDINPHIPQYISKAPWYLNQSTPGLKHQRHREGPKKSLDIAFERGVKNMNVVKYREGACENCGAITHKTKDCVERPRKKLAKHTHTNMCPDEYVLPSLSNDYDTKRDRWSGYSPNEYALVIHDYQLAEIERQRRKHQEIHQQIKDTKERKKGQKKNKNTSIDDTKADDDTKANSDTDSDSDTDASLSDDDDTRVGDFDKTSAPMGSKDDNTRTTTRNLRIREDTAKYLYNLDTNSAFYDPKSRSMRANPLQHTPEDQQVYKGDNIQRLSGEATQAQQMELFAWEVYKRNGNVHFNAMPTQLEQMYKEHLEKKTQFKDEKKQQLLDKYGGVEYLNTRKDVLFAETEEFVEYTKDGQSRPARRRFFIKSKYVEDVYYENHTSVWGSWFDVDTHKWGYACCKQINRDVECTAVTFDDTIQVEQSTLKPSVTAA